jgi:hypothetical protein
MRSSDDADIERKLSALFPPADREEAMRILAMYDSREPARVRLAILKLGGGDLRRLREQLDVALTDYRDVLAPAEFPRQIAISATERLALPPDARRTLEEADRRDYLAWLVADG